MVNSTYVVKNRFIKTILFWEVILDRSKYILIYNLVLLSIEHFTEHSSLLQFNFQIFSISVF